MGNEQNKQLTLYICCSKKETQITLDAADNADEIQRKKYYLVNKDDEEIFYREKSYWFKIKINGIEVEYDDYLIKINEHTYFFKRDTEGYKNIKIYENIDNKPVGQPFIDTLGGAHFEVIHKETDKETIYYSPKPYRVKSNRDEELNKEVKAAIDYIAGHYKEFFLEDPQKSLIGKKLGRYPSALKELKKQLLETSLENYNKAYAYFKNSACTHIRNIEKIVPLNRMNSLTPRTVKYIASHTNCLVPADFNSGIRKGYQYYQPAKVLSEQKERNFDVYENRVIIGFLKTLTTEAESLLSETPNDEKIKSLLKKCVNMQKKYDDIFRINAHALKTLPQPTPVLTTTNAYRNIYDDIRLWFRGTYSTELVNEMLLSFLSTSKLYEYYLLGKMIERFKYHNIELKRDKIKYYPENLELSQYEDPKEANIYYDEGENVVLYFQPIIKLKPNKDGSGLFIFKNKKQSNFNNEKSYDYYTPDYVIKVKKTFGGSTEYYYIILDAKYSTINNIKNNQLGKLKEKYIKGINVDKDRNFDSKKLGMIILCGQNDDSQRIIEDDEGEKYMLLPAVPGQDHIGSTKNDVDAVIDRVVSIFREPRDILFEDTFGK